MGDIPFQIEAAGSKGDHRPKAGCAPGLGGAQLDARYRLAGGHRIFYCVRSTGNGNPHAMPNIENTRLQLRFRRSQRRDVYEACSRSCYSGRESFRPWRKRSRCFLVAHVPSGSPESTCSLFGKTNAKPTPSESVRTTVDSTVIASAWSGPPASVLCRVTGISVPGSQRSGVSIKKPTALISPTPYCGEERAVPRKAMSGGTGCRAALRWSG